MSDERKLRSGRVREMVSLPFLLLPRTPSSSLPSLPCADAQGWKTTSLDNARKFHLKFTVAVPAKFCRKQQRPLRSLLHYAASVLRCGKLRNPILRGIEKLLPTDFLQISGYASDRRNANLETQALPRQTDSAPCRKASQAPFPHALSPCL